MLTFLQRFVVETFVQTLLYGIFFATFIQCLRWFLFTDEGWKLRKKMPAITMVITIFIFLMTSTSVVTLTYSTIGFSSDNPEKFMENALAVQTVSIIAWLLGLITIDSVLIYRCWMVYGKSWLIIILPTISWLGLVICTVLGVWGNLAAALNPLNQEAIRVANAFEIIFIFNIVTTVYTTAAIVYQIRSTTKASGSRGRRLSYLVRILAESGILLVFTSALSLVASYVAKGANPTWVEELISDLSGAISMVMTGIAFNLIIIRVNRSRVDMVDASTGGSREFGFSNTIAKRSASSGGTNANTSNSSGPKADTYELESVDVSHTE